ncbi:Tol-Pal system beta propeller repeat protein TolB [Marivita sp. XM-24bin2]|jgi:TolB protein|uniref:Tol-Pal system beta propeller repeat protein TolB n=1 Tax=unclassified Marivita TaxID=2632480 RepID=UPI000D79D2E1|nr:Tol-Pal system beta propeller repeat protein TolB [Marivita sp. XM-24bin2]MCR9109381.1 Tol-Pal system beta propeller repeat protein TolB [Paracoccaceae bacterium]PWL35447.1 MAG: Tol-Pal system protein TolB [Marivita sp. XM-24bin2]
MKQVLASLLAVLLMAVSAPSVLLAQSGPLRIEITEGVIEPLPYAVPDFVAESAAARDMAQRIARVVADDLTGSGLFREVPREAHISQITSFGSPVQFADWKAINAQALITGAVSSDGNRVVVKFRVWDVFAGTELGQGMQFAGTADGWRRMAHKVADQVYSRITGESGYFDSRVVFVSESGPKDQRAKRLAVMDYDGANVQYLTGGNALVLAPRFSEDGQRVLYTSYETGMPRVHVLEVGTVQSRIIQGQDGVMSFAPRFAPNGQTVVYSLTQGSNTDIWAMDIASGGVRQLTSAPSIETAPSYSPDGSQIVFESDRSGTQQLYVMPASGGEARRISFGQGRYSTPVWSPRGDMIAFTKQNAGRFHIGVMRTDGSEERLLTASFLDEGPTWAPNGRVIMFARETQGAQGSSSLYTVDISGRNLKRVRTPEGASDPSWGPLQ